MNTGAKIKNGEVGFPKYETMVLIADFFGVDIGYLTGETDEYTFSLDKACSFLGLNGAAVKAIRDITVPEEKNGLYTKERRDTFNIVLSAKNFPDFFESLQDLHLTSLDPKLQNRVFESLDSAIDYMRDLEYRGKIERYELNEALVMLINEIYPNPPKADLNISEKAQWDADRF